MLSLGSGGSNDDDSDGEWLYLKMIQLLQEHGWEFNYGRDPVLILIEIEEYLNKPEDE